MTEQERAKLLAARRAFKSTRGNGRRTSISRGKSKATGERAKLLLRAADDCATREEAAAVVGVNDNALRGWLYINTGSATWPMTADQREALRKLVWRPVTYGLVPYM